MVADRYFRLFPTPPFQSCVPTDHYFSHWHCKTVPDPLEAYSSSAAMNWLHNSLRKKKICVKPGKPPLMPAELLLHHMHGAYLQVTHFPVPVPLTPAVDALIRTCLVGDQSTSSEVSYDTVGTGYRALAEVSYLSHDTAQITMLVRR